MPKPMMSFAFGLLMMTVLAACNFTTAPQTVSTVTPEPTLTAAEVQAVAFQTTASPTPAPSATVLLATLTPSETFAPPTLLPTATATSGPYEHVIKQGVTLGYIIQLYGYADFNVIDEIVRLNNLQSADSLPGAGAMILIPRQTETPVPPTVDPLTLPATDPSASSSAMPGNSTLTQHTVQEGETILGIASQYRTTLENISVLNPEVEFPGCNFENPTGGPDCNPRIQVGQAINVPAPTPTPTLSPTPSGNETATPTPTFAAPQILYPPEGAIASGGVFRLQWVGVGMLRSDEVYLVQAQNLTSGVSFTEVTRETSMLLPDSLMPPSGETNVINWTVTVASPNADGIYRVVSGATDIYSFQWRG